MIYVTILRESTADLKRIKQALQHLRKSAAHQIFLLSDSSVRVCPTSAMEDTKPTVQEGEAHINLKVIGRK